MDNIMKPAYQRLIGGFTMRRSPILDYGQWAMMISILATALASWSRLAEHRLWQDVVIIVSGIVFGLYGALLAANWRGISRRYSGLWLSKSRGRREARRFLLIRIAGVLLIIGALATIISSVFWIITLFNKPV
jgi:hypothetical protein